MGSELPAWQACSRCPSPPQHRASPLVKTNSQTHHSRMTHTSRVVLLALLFCVTFASAHRIIGFTSLIVPTESTPSKEFAVPTDRSEHYSRDGGGFDQLTKRGTGAALMLAQRLLAALGGANHTADTNIEIRHVATSVLPVAASTAKLLQTSLKTINLTSVLAAEVPEGQDTLLNAEHVCDHVHLQLMNQYWGNPHWRRAHLASRYLLERLTDVGLYRSELHLIDLIPYQSTAQLRRHYRDNFVKDFGTDKHWERMQPYMHDQIDTAANFARRYKFYGQHHDRAPARFVGGRWLQYSTERMEMALHQWREAHSVAVTAAGAFHDSAVVAAGFARSALWSVAHEDVLLATLTALDVMNATFGNEVINVTLPQPGFHLDISLQYDHRDQSTTIDENDLLVHVRYDSHALLAADPCRRSSLRVAEVAVTNASQHFGRGASEQFAPIHRDVACCTLSEWRMFMSDLLTPAVSASYPTEGTPIGPSASDYFGAADPLPVDSEFAQRSLLPDSPATMQPVDRVRAQAREEAENEALAKRIEAQGGAENAHANNNRDGPGEGSPVSKEMWDLLFPDGVKETALPARAAAIPRVPRRPVDRAPVSSSPKCPFM